MPPRGAFDIIDELEAEKIDKPEKIEQPKPEPVKPEPKPEPKRKEPKPEPEPTKKADDNLNIFGYTRPNIEPRRRLDDIEHERKPLDASPRYTEPEKIELELEPEPFRDPWEEISDAMEKWKKCDSEVEKKILSTAILQRLDSYEKSGWDIPIHRQMSIDSFRRAASYDPAEAVNRERERELERKRQEAAELEKKYEDVKKSVKQEDDTRQRTLKKRKDELEMGR